LRFGVAFDAAASKVQVFYFRLRVFCCSPSAAWRATVKSDKADRCREQFGLRRNVMVKQKQLALSDPDEWLGQWHPLAEQLGSADGLVTLSSASTLLNLGPVHNLSSLQRFLEEYHARLLLPFELPAIQAAHGHAQCNELRELIALDCQLAREPLLEVFAAASRRVGQAQLQKLRPLRDQRLVQRYLQAVEQGQAQGWHTLVYGVTLAIYSLPLRQGLLGYAHQTTRSFIYSAARALRLSEHQCRTVFDELAGELPGAIEELLRETVAA
jgi:urease accessory protein UreF